MGSEGVVGPTSRLWQKSLKQGWGEGSATEALLTQAWEPNMMSKPPGESRAWQPTSCNTGAEETEMGGSLELTVTELQVQRQRSLSQKKIKNKNKWRDKDIQCWPRGLHMNTHMSKCTHTSTQTYIYISNKMFNDNYSKGVHINHHWQHSLGNT